MFQPFCLSLLAVCFALTTAVEQGGPQEAGAGSPKTTIDDFDWLAGHWRGEGLGGVCEEVWSRPLAGTMMGTFRLVQDGEVVFYELMVIGEDDHGMALKVKHFSKDFVAWEDKEGAVRFAAESVKPGEARFSGLTIKRDGDGLDLSLRMRSSDGSVRWEPFAMRRTSADGK